MQDKSEYIDNELEEQLVVTRLIIMDNVSGLADKSEEFCNFLTFSQKNTAFPAFMNFIQYILAGKVGR